MAARRAPGPAPAPTFACFRPDRRGGGSTASGHGLWLIDAPATLAQVLAADPTAPLPDRQRPLARQALQAASPLPCRGLQRVDWIDADGRLGSLTFAIGLDRRDRQRLLQSFDLVHPFGPGRPDDPAAMARMAQRPPRPALPILVVGAGLAGCFTAAALARRGHRVVVVERERAAGGAVADVPLIAQHPALSADDNARSRLSRTALLLAWRLRGLAGPALQWCGRRQRVDGDPSRLLAGWPPELARLERQGGETRGDERTGKAAGEATVIRFDRCALALTGRLLARLVSLPGIELRCGQAISTLHRDPSGWWAHDGGRLIAPGPFAAVIVACPGHETLTGLGPPWLPPGHREPGRVLIGEADSETDSTTGSRKDDDGGCETNGDRNDEANADPPAVGLPASIEGGHRAGGETFRLESGRCRVLGLPGRSAGADSGRTPEADAGAFAPADAAGWRWRLSRPAMRLDPIDHLPLVGPVPDPVALHRDAAALARNDRLAHPLQPDLYLATGLGGRGLLWSWLAGEMLAARIDDEPPLVEASLAAAIDPGRFARRRLRRGVPDPLC